MNWFMLNKITLHDMLTIDHREKEWKKTIDRKLGSSFNNPGDKKCGKKREGNEGGRKRKEERI